jgi:peptidoglycan/LPS O-acetylase OafA/YrhL
VVRGGDRSIGYQPALDGVRAVAVVLVLLFHLGVDWMTGGYLGVSVFFTLSGFLITTLLVTELERTGRIDLLRFYGRRARRLLPAALVCLVGVCIIISADLAPDRSGLRWYVFGALFQFANWVPLGLSNSYAELFAAPTPTDHFWSLAIEEQFYWLWPLTMLGLAMWARRRRGDAWLRRLSIGVVVLFVVTALSAPVTAQLWSHDAAYFATWARIAEILAGAVLAVAVFGRKVPAPLALLAPAALALIVVLCVVTPAGHGFAYDGGLPLFAVASAALIAGLQVPSATRSLLSLRPIVFVGQISYGLYVYHWPVFVVLTRARTDLATLPLNVLRLAVTFAIAVVSYYVVELPVRERRVLRDRRRALSGVAFSVPVVALLGVALVGNTSSFEGATETLPPVTGSIAPLTPATATPTTVVVPSTTTATVTTTTTTTVPATTTTEHLVPSRPVRMLVVGDSTALVTGRGLMSWAEDNADLAQVELQAFGGCGIITDGDRRYRDEWMAAPQGCVGLIDQTVPQRVRDAQPDVVVVVSAFWDNSDHRWPPDDTPLSPLDPEFRRRALERFSAYTQTLLDAGAPKVAWVLYPATDDGWGDRDETSDDPARYEASYEVQREAAARFPGRAVVVDFAAWSDAQGLTASHDARPDGVHWSEGMSRKVVDDYLADALIQAALH